MYVQYRHIFNNLLSENIIHKKYNRNDVSWRCQSVSPDGKMLVLCCTVSKKYQEGKEGNNEGKEGKEGKTKENRKKKSTSILILWNVKKNCLLSFYKLPTDMNTWNNNANTNANGYENQNQNENAWKMTYDLRHYKHLERTVSTATSSLTTPTLKRADIHVNSKPYTRAPETFNAMKRTLEERSIHVITLITAGRWCQLDVTVPYKQLISMARRVDNDNGDKRDVTYDYLLPLLSERVKKKERKKQQTKITKDLGESRTGPSLSRKKKNAVFSKVKTMGLLGSNFKK